MSCNLPIEKGVRRAADCKCYGAVMRTYKCLKHSGNPDSIALEAAQIVYSYHHPEDSKQDQRLTVERWVNQGSLH